VLSDIPVLVSCEWKDSCINIPREDLPFSELDHPGGWWRYFVRVRACGFPPSALSLLGNFDTEGSTHEYLEEMQHNIKTIGDLRRLDKVSVDRFPIISPKIPHARPVLMAYKKLMEVQVESDVTECCVMKVEIKQQLTNCYK